MRRPIRWPFRAMAKMSPAARAAYVRELERARSAGTEPTLPPELLEESEDALDRTMAGLRRSDDDA